jgi:hypothetical protein
MSELGWLPFFASVAITEPVSPDDGRHHFDCAIPAASDVGPKKVRR